MRAQVMQVGAQERASQLKAQTMAPMATREELNDSAGRAIQANPENYRTKKSRCQRLSRHRAVAQPLFRNWPTLSGSHFQNHFATVVKPATMDAMKMLRCFLLLLLAIALPFNAAMAGFMQLKEADGHALSAPGRVSIHEHHSIFGAAEQHTHKVGDEVKLDTCKPCSFAKDAPSSHFSHHPLMPHSAVWSRGDVLFPNDHAPAPPEHPPKTRV